MYYNKMIIQDILIKFWQGKITLWKSYWIVGELLNSIIVVVIFNIELKFFNNTLIFETIPFLSFNNLHLINRLLIILWTIYITIGIWRSAEKYNGRFIWSALTLTLLSYRLFILRVIFY